MEEKNDSKKEKKVLTSAESAYGGFLRHRVIYGGNIPSSARPSRLPPLTRLSVRPSATFSTPPPGRLSFAGFRGDGVLDYQVAERSLTSP